METNSIIMARKPLSEKSVAENVLRWGTGGINIDESRIGNEKISAHHAPKGTFAGGEEGRGSIKEYYDNEGRFPANIIFDEEAGKILDQQSGITKSKKSSRGAGYTDSEIYCSGDLSFHSIRGHNDEGGASRYFLKIDKNE